MAMKVLMTLIGDESLKDVETPEGVMRTMQAWGEFGQAAQEAGVFVVCDALEAADMTTTVRVDGGRRVITDGPYIETKEQLGGVVILDVRDLDEALQWAERSPWNRDGCVTEIRPIMDYEGYAARAAAALQERAAS
jgi:hypothetical protein